MSARRRAVIAVLRVLLCGAIAIELFVLHFPGPSGVSDGEAREDVRGAWHLFARVARAGGELVPAALDPLIDGVFDDKAIHFALFFPLALLWASIRRLKRSLDARGGALVFGVLSAYAGAGELAQSFGGRVPELGDWIANVIGAAAGVLAAFAGAELVRRGASMNARWQSIPRR